MQMDRFIAPSGDGGNSIAEEKMRKNNKLRLDLRPRPALARGPHQPVSQILNFRAGLSTYSWSDTGPGTSLARGIR